MIIESISGLRDLAIKWHGKQMYGDQPYAVHLDAVHDVTVRHGLPVEYQRAAFGHDLLEDVAGMSKFLVEHSFGMQEGLLIYYVSTYGSNRKERTERKINQLNHYEPAINLYMADRIANYGNALRTLDYKKMAMYAGEYELPGYVEIHKRAKLSMQVELSGIHMQAVALLAQRKQPN